MVNNVRPVILAIALLLLTASYLGSQGVDMCDIGVRFCRGWSCNMLDGYWTFMKCQYYQADIEYNYKCGETFCREKGFYSGGVRSECYCAPDRWPPMY